MRRVLGVLLCALFLSAGCAQIQTSHEVLHKLTRADLESALAIATKYNHKAGMQCYPVLLRALDQDAATVSVRGAVSAFEIAHVLLNDYSTEMMDTIHLACAPLIVDAEKTIIGLAVKFGIAP